MSCFVCCEPYNKSTRAKIVCGFGDCNYECCKGCIRTYLLSTTNDPHCMNCKRGYTQNFIVTNLNRSFNDTDFKKHRKTLLVDREMSRMPETMEFAENYKKIDEYQENIRIYNEKIKELNAELSALQQVKNEEYRKINLAKNGKLVSEERKKFIFPCPNEGCRGYLSTQYKCELCKLYTCPHCHEIIGHNREDPHTCDPNNVATTEEIKKTCKGCPSCGVRIQKISGCDQMYCTECRIAFSWNTGKIDSTGNIHNPHYYQLMKKENGGQATRNPQDILCGGLINYYQLGNIRRSLPKTQLDKFRTVPHQLDETLSLLHRFVNHITNYELPRFRERVRNISDNRMLRIEYLNQKLTKEQLTTKVYNNDMQRKKSIDILQIYETLSVVGIENFTALYNNKSRNSPEFVDEVNRFIDTYRNLIRYTNREMKLISITYNNSVMIIDDNFEYTYKKFLTKELPTILKETVEPATTSSSSGAGCSTDPV